MVRTACGANRRNTRFFGFLVGLYDYNGETVIIFATEQNLKLLFEADFWIVDETFKCCRLLYARCTLSMEMLAAIKRRFFL